MNLKELQPIWDKAEVRNGTPDQCRCLCGYKCKPRCKITKENVIECVALHYHAECGHDFEDGRCLRCDLSQLDHRILSGP